MVQSLKRRIVVGKGFSLTHGHDVCNARAKVVTHKANLVVHFSCMEVSSEATPTGSAKDAAHSAACLCAKANGEPLSVAAGYANRLHANTVG